MKVHHLNCGTMHPPFVPTIVTHVLLVEADNGLVLTDTGFGLADIADPGRIGPARHLLRPVFDIEETAAHQVERLGFARTDVSDIVITHFDIDHIGGIADFPHARIHVTTTEAGAAMRSPSRQEKFRYRPAQWAHGPKLVEHDPSGEKWRGFAAAKELTEISSGIVMVSLPGHSRGHACVAVDSGQRWVLHCGDAFYHRGSVDRRTPVPRVMQVFESANAFNRAQMHENHERLAELYHRGDPDMLLICAHDQAQLQRVLAG